MAGDSSRWSWIIAKSGGDSFSSDQLRFLDAKIWPLELDRKRPLRMEVTII
jgi:hypothetical protein